MIEYQKIKLLWLEDNAQIELPHLTVPLYMSGRFDFVLAENATDALLQFQDPFDYDVVIFDLRLPPGNDQRFIELYKKLSSQNRAPRLGLHLLLNLLNKAPSGIEIEGVGPVDGFDINKVGILSVDKWSDIEGAFDEFDFDNVCCYEQKHAGMKRTALLDLIDRVLENQD